MADTHGKRPRRADSSTTYKNEPPAKRARDADGRDRRHDDTRHRSHSRDRGDRRHDRSRSRERPRNNGDKRDRSDPLARDRYRGHVRERSRSRDGHRAKRDSSRRWPRSRSPQRDGYIKRDRTPPRFSAPSTKSMATSASKMELDNLASGPNNGNAPAADADEDSDTAIMKQMLGFSGFRSTKNTKVPGNNVGSVRKDKQAQYRQYMNRVGGFNRPLSPSR